MAVYEKRPAPGEYASYYGPYVARVPEGDPVALLEQQLDDTCRLLSGLSDAQADHAYAPGKWTVKEVVGHITDAERVFAYRVMRFGRGDTTDLAGFDENAYVPAGAFAARSLASLVEEFAAVRRATIALLRNLPDEAWLRQGTANGYPVSVRALAYIIAGHELHHRAILEERYGIREMSGV